MYLPKDLDPSSPGVLSAPASRLRPTTLSSTAHKFIAKAVSSALEALASGVVHPAQRGGAVRSRMCLRRCPRCTSPGTASDPSPLLCSLTSGRRFLAFLGLGSGRSFGIAVPRHGWSPPSRRSTTARIRTSSSAGRSPRRVSRFAVGFSRVVRRQGRFGRFCSTLWYGRSAPVTPSPRDP